MGQPEQQQEPPGTERQMDPVPDHGEESYRGSGRLAGKAAVITGADSGIGKAVAIAFAREGADVLISYLTSMTTPRTPGAGSSKQAAGRCWFLAISPIRPAAGPSSPRRSRSSAGSTSWSATPRSR